MKALYAKWHNHGLEIVGVSLDRDVESVQKACKSQGLTWPQVAAAVGRSPVYAAMLVYGYGQATAEEADGLVKRKSVGKKRQVING